MCIPHMLIHKDFCFTSSARDTWFRSQNLFMSHLVFLKVKNYPLIFLDFWGLLLLEWMNEYFVWEILSLIILFLFDNKKIFNGSDVSAYFIPVICFFNV